MTNEGRPLKVLLIYPRFPNTFWSFHYAFKFVAEKSFLPPLGLLTVAALLPKSWEKRLVDLNVDPLSDEDIAWADCVFLSAMEVQQGSAREIIARVRGFGRKIVAGGPLFTVRPDEYPDVDHLVLREAEATLPSFLADFRKGEARPVYAPSDWPELNGSPVPDWGLLDLRDYAVMCLQYSRGCPYDCEFCDISLLNGKKIRTKRTDQIIEELEALYQKGWRGPVLFADDNFIGRPGILKESLLPALITWLEDRRFPFRFMVQASINLADDEDLMALMVRANFDSVFVGIESPEEKSLEECRKVRNKDRDPLNAVKKIQRYGLQVAGGFIVGFDSDPPDIFQKQIDFIQESAIVKAMVVLLNAQKGTRLYQRLKQEGRLVRDGVGDGSDTNLIPKMGYERLVEGYRTILSHIYAPRHYYRRVVAFLRGYNPPYRTGMTFRFNYLKAFFHSMWTLGMLEKERYYYWKALFWTLARRPRLFSLCVRLAIYGYHFRKVYGVTK